MQVTKVTRFTAEEERLIGEYIEAYMMPVVQRIQNDHNRSLQKVNEALDEVVEAAVVVREARMLEQRITNMVEALEGRVEQLESEFGY